MSTQYTTVPWTSPSALLTLSAALYPQFSSPSPSNDPTTLPRALALIQAWKLRNSNLPHAIEATYLLLSAQHHHAQILLSLRQTTTSPPSPVHLDPTTTLTLRSLYTQSFTRFVTGFCDISRARSRLLSPPSMHDVARQIGLPAEFVDVRHEATHEDLPGLQRLVRVTGEGLEWLWGWYWGKLTVEDDREEEEGGEEEELERVLKGWRRGRVEALKSGKEERGDSEGMMMTVVKESKRWSGKAIAEALVNGKMIFPARRDLRTPLTGAFTLWQPLLTTLSSSHPSFPQIFITTLQNSVISPATSSSSSSFDTTSESLSLWLLHTLHPTESWIPLESASKSERDKWRRECMMWCCSNPGYWSRFVGERLLEMGGSRFREVWEDVLEASRLDGDALAGSSAGGGGRDAGDEIMEDVDAEPEVEPKVVLKKAATASSSVSKPAGRVVKRGWRKMAVAPTWPIGVVP